MSGHLDVGEVRMRLAEHLGAAAVAHSIAVAETAAWVAESYGLDSDKAYLAGLLHDWAREDEPESLLRSATRLGIEVGDIDRKIPYLLHAPVGAAQVETAFPDVGLDVVAAVSTHTVGAVDMQDLSSAVYVADMIEPQRRFDGVEALRDAVGAVPLKELFARAYAASIAHLVARRRHLHPDTVAVWNTIADGGEE